MKLLLAVSILCLAITCRSQAAREIEYFKNGNNNNDSTFKYFMSILSRFNPNDEFGNDSCGEASERIGDYYKSKGDYLKAIAYYDSADNKYRFKFTGCAYAYYCDFIPRRYKVSQRYLANKNIKQAITTLTPYLFNSFSFCWFDSTLVSYYLSTVRLMYSRKEVDNLLTNSITNVHCQYDFLFFADSTKKCARIYGTFILFDTKVIVEVLTLVPQKVDKILPDELSRLWYQKFKETEMYKILSN